MKKIIKPDSTKIILEIPEEYINKEIQFTYFIEPIKPIKERDYSSIWKNPIKVDEILTFTKDEIHER